MIQDKWRVRYSILGGKWWVYPPGLIAGYIGGPSPQRFPTWREAWDYAIAKATEVRDA